MEQPIIVIAALNLIGVIAFIVLYLMKEKRKAETMESDFKDLKDLLRGVQTNIAEISRQMVEKFHAHADDIRLSQNEANQKVSAGFEQMQLENTSVRKEVDEKIADIKTAFKDYSEKVNETLAEYSNDNAEFKKDTDKIKEQIHKELQKILGEIKAPLDLD